MIRWKDKSGKIVTRGEPLPIGSPPEAIEIAKLQARVKDLEAQNKELALKAALVDGTHWLISPEPAVISPVDKSPNVALHNTDGSATCPECERRKKQTNLRTTRSRANKKAKT